MGEKMNFLNRYKIKGGVTYVFDEGESIIMVIPSSHCEGFDIDAGECVGRLYHVICDNAYMETSYELLTADQILEKYRFEHKTSEDND